MSKIKKIISFTLSLALMVTSVFVGGVAVSAAAPATSEFFCGFEGYAVTRTNESAIPSYATLATGGSYAGSKHMQLSVTADSLATFEIRDSKGFETLSGKNYSVSFYYKSTADIKYYIGTAQGNKVTKTATAITGGELSAANSWTKVTLDVTLDKGRNEGFVPVMMVQSNTNATTEFDNISLVYANESMVNIEDYFVSNNDYYPALNGMKQQGSTANVWDGSTATAPSGSGSEEDPYKIATGANLYYVVKNGGAAGKHYVFTADIFLNNPIHVNWLTGSINYGYTVKNWNVGRNTVQGIFDGQGYGVYGFYKHGDSAEYSGESTPVNGAYDTAIFGGVPDGGSLTIKNLNVDKMYVRENAGAGALVGYVGKGATLNIENCSVGQEVFLDGAVVGSLVCGVGANNATVNITNSYSLASGYSHYGRVAFVGWTHWTNPSTVTFTNCYNAFGKMITEKRNTITATNCYEGADGPLDTGVKTLSAANMKGSDVLTNAAKMSGLGSAYTAKTATFAEANKDMFVRLPEGTYFETNYSAYTYDAQLAPIDKAKVVANGTATRGAYYRFLEKPDVSKIYVPASKIDEVKYGTAQFLFAEDYFDVRTSMIEAKLETQPGTAVNYLFITDTHFATGTSQFSDAASARQFELAIEMANKLDSIDFVALGGDIVSGNDATAEVCLEKLNKYLAPAKECNKPVLMLTGNHDDNSYGGVADSVTVEQFAGKLISPDQWQETIIDQFVKRKQADGSFLYEISQNKDPYNAAKTNSKYYYYDIKEKNTRVICVNASDYEYHYDSNGNFAPNIKNDSAVNAQDKTYNGNNFWGYSDYQVKWLAEKALGELPEGYNVIMLSHMRIDKEPTSNGGTRNYNNGTVLQAILEAYHARNTYTNQTLNINVDFTEDTGRIMIYQHGHEHTTAAGLYTQNVLNVWRISSGTANPYKSGADSNKGISGPNARVKNENLGDIDAISVTPGYILRQSNGVGNVATNGTGLFFNNFVVQKGDITLDSVIDICDLVKINILKDKNLPAQQAEGVTVQELRTIIINKASVIAPEEPQGCKHEYDNICDTNCNLCDEERQVGSHTYDDEYDADCNECGAVRAVEERPIEYWDGKTTEPTKTDSQGNILISKPSELAYVIKTGGGEGKNYKLTTDIYLNNITKINWATGEKLDSNYKVQSWYTNDDCTAHFTCSTIDGDGHVIYGMYYEGNPESYTTHPTATALIPRLKAGTNITITNLGMDNFYLNHKNTVSAFIGTAMGNDGGLESGGTITFSSCYAGKNGTLKGAYAGVFRSYAYKKVNATTLTNCYSLSSATGTSGAGFIANQNDYIAGTKTVRFTNCYNANGSLNSGNNFGSVATATNCYATEIGGTGNLLSSGVTKLDAEAMQGENSSMSLGEAYVLTDEYPVLKVFPIKTTEQPQGCKHTYDDEYDADCNKCGEERDVPERPIVIWNGKTSEPTKTDASGNILISNGSELAYIISTGGGEGKSYKLTSNIYLNDISKINWQTGEVQEDYTVNKWYQDKAFQGTIDGDGYVVYGMYFNGNPTEYTAYQNGVGLVPVVAANTVVTIKNLGVDNAYIHNRTSASAFVAGTCDGATLTMDSCYAGANVTLIGASATALRGHSQTNRNNVKETFTNCYSLASLDGKIYSGLAGTTGSRATMTNCFNANGAISTSIAPGYNYIRTNCYQTERSVNTDGRTQYDINDVVSKQDMQGENALTVMKLGDAFTVTEGFPVLKIFK